MSNLRTNTLPTVSTVSRPLTLPSVVVRIGVGGTKICHWLAQMTEQKVERLSGDCEQRTEMTIDLRLGNSPAQLQSLIYARFQESYP